MKPVSVSEEMLGDSETLIIQNDDNPFNDIKALVTKSIDGEPRYSVRFEVEAEDLFNLIENDGAVWVTFMTPMIPDFMVFTTEV